MCMCRNLFGSVRHECVCFTIGNEQLGDGGGDELTRGLVKAKGASLGLVVNLRSRLLCQKEGSPFSILFYLASA